MSSDKEPDARPPVDLLQFCRTLESAIYSALNVIGQTQPPFVQDQLYQIRHTLAEGLREIDPDGDKS